MKSVPDTNDFPSWLAPYRPTVPLAKLVEELNLIYHAFDSDRYEADTIEIRQLWPNIWSEMLQQLPERGSWRVLDFGSGTGFEAEQTLKVLGDRVSLLMAYDPSAAMLAKARAKLGHDQRVMFESIESNLRQRAPYDLLITNSVLHHMPAVPDFRQYLTEDAYWISGNEPSSRFYSNAECLELYREYAAHQERTKWFRPSRYIGKIKSLLHMESLSKTADAAHRKKLFGLRPRPDVVARLVDFHVHDGFDFAAMNTGWQMRWHRTYSFLGPFSELRALRHWRARAAAMRLRFPDDGACFCAVWARQ